MSFGFYERFENICGGHAMAKFEPGIALGFEVMRQPRVLSRSAAMIACRLRVLEYPKARPRESGAGNRPFG